MRPRVFNSRSYLELEADRVGGTPIRLACGGGGPEIGLIVRQIPGSSRRDGVSVYGLPDLDQRETIAGSVETDRIVEALQTARAVDGLVSAYFRLGLSQDVQVPSDPSVARRMQMGDVVVIDLQRDWFQIFSGFQPRLRARIRNGYDGIDVEASDDIMAFHHMYTENMLRVGASKDYFFSEDYMRRLFSIPGVNLFLAMDSGGPLGGTLVVTQGDQLFYHLGAVSDRGLARSTLKCVLSEVMRRHAGGPFQRLVLGGGLGGKSDSLLRFKRLFSNEMQPTFALKVILDRQSYAALSGAGRDREPFAGFFPAYRDPARIEEAPPCPPPSSQPGPRSRTRRSGQSPGCCDLGE